MIEQFSQGLFFDYESFWGKKFMLVVVLILSTPAVGYPVGISSVFIRCCERLPLLLLDLFRFQSPLRWMQSLSLSLLCEKGLLSTLKLLVGMFCFLVGVGYGYCGELSSPNLAVDVRSVVKEETWGDSDQFLVEMSVFLNCLASSLAGFCLCIDIHQLWNSHASIYKKTNK